MEFNGKPLLIASLDAAIQASAPHARPEAIADVLRRLYRDPTVRLPAALKAPVDGHYARRELHLSAELGYSLVAMAWAPGQGTPLHDHDGAWCVEGVWQGRLHVQDYLLMEHDERFWQFRSGQISEISRGQTSLLQQPGDYHRVYNPDPTEVAVSIHVYSHRLLRCHVYEPADEANAAGVYLRRERVLATD